MGKLKHTFKKGRGSHLEGGGVLHLASSLKPYLIVFIASTCGMVIEIVAARILAPGIGVSLYTWTSVIGVVLAGTEKLKPLIMDPQGRFGQISSRVGFWPPVIKGITPDDSEALAMAALSDIDVELSEEVLDAFWQMCDGSARVLVSALIPGIKDYGLKKKKELTPELIYKVGQNLLGFKKTRRV